MDPLLVRDVMDREYVAASETDGLRETARLLREHDATTAVVLRGDTPQGLLDAAAVLERVAAGDVENATVGDAMARPPESLPPDATLADAAAALRRAETDTLLVADDDVRGLLTARDVATAGRVPVEAAPAAEERAPSAGPDDRDANASDEFSAQSVCEACGSLSSSLANVNGQLVCPDCYDV